MNFSRNLAEKTIDLLKPKSNKLEFGWFDTVIVFIVIFVFNIFNGIYFKYFARKQTTVTEYLLGGRSMKILPIVVSLTASYTSANILLSVPADVYRYGAAYLLGGISTLIMTIVTIYVYLPVFYNLRITSVYEYLERRFDYKTRMLASLLSIMSHILYLPIVIYVPSLSLASASGIDVHFIATAVCGLCIFYTAIGGLKAVVWTDTVQFTIAMTSVIIVFILGFKSIGSFGTIWEKIAASERLDIFDFDVNPTKRDSFWSIVIGLTTHRIATVTVAQSCVQKFLAIPTFRKSVLSVIYFGIGSTVVKTITVFLGLLIYAKYSECDPLLAKKISTDNEITTFFVVDVAKSTPGLSGLFIAGVLSASLSTLSADLNCLAGIIYEDFVSKMSREKYNEQQATFFLKIIVVLSGAICTFLVYVVERLGGLFSLGMSVGGVTGGSVLGMFTLGILFPISNAKGAFYGGLCSLVVMAGIIFPAEYYQMEGFLNHAWKPVSISGCGFENFTRKDVQSLKEVPVLFRISFYYYVFLGTCIALIVGLIISFLTKENNYAVDEKFISPLYYSLLRKSVVNNSAKFNLL